MRNWLKVLIALFPLYASGATVWTWIDDQGRRHYSDIEMPGATRIELGEPQSFSGSATDAPAAGTTNASATDTASEEAPVAYTVLDIISPKPQETHYNIGGVLEVELGIYPPLGPNHQVAAILDGERKGTPVRATTLSLTDVFRGEHSLQVMIIDADDTVLMRSSPVTFFVQQTSIQN